MIKVTLAFENERLGLSPSFFEMPTFPSAEAEAPFISPLRLKSEEPS